MSLRSLIWISLSVENKQKNAPKCESCPLATWEQRIPIRACASALPDLDCCLLEKSTAAWELSLRPMRTANTYMSLRIRAAWSGLCYLLKISKTKAYSIKIKSDWKFVAFDMIICHRNYNLIIHPHIILLDLYSCGSNKQMPHSFLNDIAGVCSSVKQGLNYNRPVSMRTDRPEQTADPDGTPQNAASHQGLHCLPLIKQFLDTRMGSKLYLLKFYKMLKVW